MKAHIHIVERDVEIHLHLALTAVDSHRVPAFDVVHGLTMVVVAEECLKEVTDGEMKDYAMMLLDWAVSKRTVIEREDE